jgi:hypothetical protein
LIEGIGLLDSIVAQFDSTAFLWAIFSTVSTLLGPPAMSALAP